MTGSPPSLDDPDARIAWIIKRAQTLDFVRSEQWIADEIERMWNDPEGFEDGGMYEVPEGIEERDYALFKLGVAFGIDYEHYFPTGDRESWIETEEIDHGD